nr:aldehyde dehydrogenase family protein [Paracoccus sp. S-4012]
MSVGRHSSGQAVRVAEQPNTTPAGRKLNGEVIPVPTTHVNYTWPEPYGALVQITPWNAPQISPTASKNN